MDTEDDSKLGKKNKKNTSDSSFYDNSSTSDESYDDFYSDSSEDTTSTEVKNGDKKNLIKYVIAGVLAIIFIVLLVFIFLSLGKKNTKLPQIQLINNSISVKVGNKDYIAYEIVNTDEVINVIFQSQDTNIATVDEAGGVVGVKEGKTSIKLLYNNGKKDLEEICNVEVLPGESSNPVDPKKEPPTLTLSASTTNWIKENVNIKVSSDAQDLKYAVNCGKDCSYNKVSNNTITISENGTSNVTVIATNTSGQTTTKSITVKVDKKAPTVELLPNQTTFASKTAIEVCAVCTDSESGCKESKVCKTFQNSASNQTITVEDKAGNKATTKAFKVEINKVQLTCSLSVSTSGVVTATHSGNPSYYGYNSNYSGPNEVSKKLPNNVNNEQTVVYYMKDKDGTTKRCSLTVITACWCRWKNNAGECYRSVSVVGDPVNGKCSKGELKASGDHSGKCVTYSDKGIYCESRPKS